MKKHFLILKGMLSVSLIVLSIAILVNYQTTGQARKGNTRVADGVPLPPPPPPKSKLGVVLTADGVPLPPPPPPKSTSLQVADGAPLPTPTQLFQAA